MVIDSGRKRVVRERRLRPEDWEVVIPDHHEAYISWQEYLKNQETLVNNRNQMGETVQGAARRGKGILAGLIRCGHCGRKMQVQYGGGHSTRKSVTVYYICRASQREEIQKQNCSLFGGVTLEEAIVQAVLHAIQPIRMEALREATERLANKRGEKRRQLELDLERSRYEADRCQRQYQVVEPENRLVARTLEARWNQALNKVEQLENQLSQLTDCDATLSADELNKLRSLAADLPSLWNHPDAPCDLKKGLLRTVIQEIVVYVDSKTIRALVHWRGGQHTELNLRKRKTGEHRWKASDDAIALIQQLARQMSDKQIAAQLNRMGIKSAKGHTWTRVRVGNFRNVNGIANYVPGERQARGELTIEEAATILGVSYSTVQRMIQRKQLPASQICPGAPWILRADDVYNTVQQGPSSPSSKQQNLDFAEDI